MHPVQLPKVPSLGGWIPADAACQQGTQAGGGDLGWVSALPPPQPGARVQLVYRLHRSPALPKPPLCAFSAPHVSLCVLAGPLLQQALVSFDLLIRDWPEHD